MAILAQLRALTPAQRNAFLAAYLGWTLDAFDYFLMVFVLKDPAPRRGRGCCSRPWPAGPSGRSCSAWRLTATGGACR